MQPSEKPTPHGRKFPFTSSTTKTRSSPSNQWAQYFTPEGRPYYHNAHTGQSTWTVPTLPTPTALPNFRHWPQDAAECAFMQLLVAQQVDHSWEWDAVLRATVSQPAYRGVEGGMPRRKALWLAYWHQRKEWQRGQVQVQREEFICRLKAMPFGKEQLLTAQAVGKACEGQQWRPAFPSDRRNEWLGQWLEGRERGPKGDDALGKFFADRPWNCSHAEALSLWHDSHPSVPCSSREFAKKWLEHSKSFFTAAHAQSAQEAFESLLGTASASTWKEFYQTHKRSPALLPGSIQWRSSLGICIRSTLHMPSKYPCSTKNA